MAKCKEERNKAALFNSGDYKEISAECINLPEDAKWGEETEKDREWEYALAARQLGMVLEYENTKKINDIHDKIMKQENTQVQPKSPTELIKESIKNITGISAVFLYYPEFENDLLLLQEHKYIILENAKITWLKRKKH